MILTFHTFWCNKKPEAIKCGFKHTFYYFSWIKSTLKPTFYSIKRGVILTFYTFCSNKKPEANKKYHLFSILPNSRLEDSCGRLMVVSPSPPSPVAAQWQQECTWRKEGGQSDQRWLQSWRGSRQRVRWWWLSKTASWLRRDLHCTLHENSAR